MGERLNGTISIKNWIAIIGAVLAISGPLAAAFNAIYVTPELSQIKKSVDIEKAITTREISSIKIEVKNNKDQIAKNETEIKNIQIQNAGWFQQINTDLKNIKALLQEIKNDKH